MPSDIAQTEQIVTEDNDRRFAWKVNLKFCRQSRQTEKWRPLTWSWLKGSLNAFPGGGDSVVTSYI